MVSIVLCCVTLPHLLENLIHSCRMEPWCTLITCCFNSDTGTGTVLPVCESQHVHCTHKLVGGGREGGVGGGVQHWSRHFLVWFNLCSGFSLSLFSLPELYSSDLGPCLQWVLSLFRFLCQSYILQTWVPASLFRLWYVYLLARPYFDQSFFLFSLLCLFYHLKTDCRDKWSAVPVIIVTNVRRQACLIPWLGFKH